MWQKLSNLLKKLTFQERREPWQIAVSRFCVNSSEKGFTYDEYRQFLNQNYSIPDFHIARFFEEEIQHPSGRQFPRTAETQKQTWTAPLELVSKITDYEELREARRNAKQAFRLSWASLVLAFLSLIFTATAALK